MPQLLNRVRPGDVITADMWNQIVDAVNDLLEDDHGSTDIQIASMTPDGSAGAPLRVGAMLQITGQNFGFSLGTTQVTFESQTGSVVITRDRLLTGSSDTRLLLTVPAIPNLPQAGALFTIRVDNGLANDVRLNVLVTPVLIVLTGDVFVSWRSDVATNPNPNPIVPNQGAEFAFRLQTGINMPATFDLGAEIIDATTAIPPGLVSSIEFRGESGVITNKRLDLGRSETRNIVVRIPQIPPSFDRQSFKLVVSAASGDVRGSETRAFEVGTIVPPTDETILIQQTGTLVLNQAGDVDPDGGRLEGSTIRLKPGRQMIVQLNVTCTHPGRYDLTPQARPGTPTTGWEPRLVATATTIETTTANPTRFVQFGVTAAASSSATGAVQIRVRRQGATLDQFKEYSVALLPAG